MPLYPMKFKPRFVEKMWGGRKIETVLGKPLPPGAIGESWELYDFPPGVVEQSADWISGEVAEGRLAGKTLHELVGQFGRELCGDVPLAPQGQFPLLVKFLDARQDLSVQVHPDPAYAKTHPGAHLKNEAWFIVQADSGSRLLMGLKGGVTRQSFAQSIADGSVESTINSIPVKAGDCFYLPSGTVHALGAGILAAEVQTPSDTTYRVFDFNRIDPSTGKRRALHVEQAMQCIDFSATTSAKPNLSSGPELVECDHFAIRKFISKKAHEAIISSGQPKVLMVITGRGRLLVSGQETAFRGGDTVLLPAGLAQTVITTDADSLWLEVTIKGNA